MSRNRRSAVAYFMMMLTLLLLTEYPYEHTSVFFTFFVLIGVVGAARFLLGVAYLRDGSPSRDAVYRTFTIVFPLSAGLFGVFAAATAWLYGPGWITALMYLAVALAAISNVVTFSSSMPLAGAGLVAIALPAIATPAVLLGDKGIALALVPAAYFFVLFTVLRGLNREYWEALEGTALLEDHAEQLSLARDAALEADRLKSLLVATVSHELRTPLHGIVGNAELLLRDDLAPRAHRRGRRQQRRAASARRRREEHRPRGAGGAGPRSPAAPRRAARGSAPLEPLEQRHQVHGRRARGGPSDAALR
jgi:signal transduction histidine kinase